MRRKNGTDSPSLSEETKRNVYFYHHSIEDHIASLAEQAGDKNLVAPITAELVRLLEAKALWESFRTTQSLPEMRTQRNGNRNGGWPGDTARTLAADLSRNSSGRRPLSAKARKAISKAQRKRWAKFHTKQEKGPKPMRGSAQRKRTSAYMKAYWAKMTPAQRARENARRREVSAAKKAAAA